ncbi:ABC transporter transmembrane domain-containing protein [Actinomyces mediterranea]|uniref:ABC transporter transmembrane domain-containing protein n=1 Tax=Actinomyces mediterranea TaxID=1871028 RepID=UPI000970A0FF|nr:ABC transporter ATP-binding protein [Actinomyces mediterranea]
MRDPLARAAADAGIALPPLGPTPRHWIAPWRTLRGPAWPLPAAAPRFARELLRRRVPALALGVAATTLGTVASALVPWAMGGALDTALATGVSADLAIAGGVFLLVVVLVAVGDALTQMTEITTWMGSSVGSARTVASYASMHPRAVKRDSTAGDVVTATNSDASALGRATSLIPEFVASAAATILVAFLMLRTSLSLGLIVLIGMPILVIGLMALGGPLEARQSMMRDEQGELTTISTDAVQGLRILRGIGGEDSYSRAYRAQSQRARAAAVKVAPTAALLAATRSAVPMLFSVLVVAQGAMLIFDGVMSVGQLLAFYGYMTFLRHPLWILSDSVEHLTRAWVAVKRASSILAIQPLTCDEVGASASSQREDHPTVDSDSIDWASATVEDPLSGVRLRPGLTTALLAPSVQIARDVARRLARVSDDESSAILSGSGFHVPLASLPVGDVRKHILLSEETPQLFAGSLRENLLGADTPPPPRRPLSDTIYREIIASAPTGEKVLLSVNHDPSDDDPALLDALTVAAASDVLSSLPGGLDGLLAESGRNVSGGQRQRIALARALVHDPDIALFVEPTSALDSHTEALIGERLAKARDKRTTLLITESPLLLDYADHIIILDSDGRAVASGNLNDLRVAVNDGVKGVAQTLALLRRGDAR